MKPYKTKAKSLTGTKFRKVHQKAFGLYKQIKAHSKRRTYVRSAYFKKDKVFIDIFWHHLFEKPNWKDRVRRLKYFPAAIEVYSHTNTILGKILSPPKLWHQYEQKYLKKVDKIITVVDEAKERLIKLGIEPDLITVVSNTLNLDKFRLHKRNITKRLRHHSLLRNKERYL